MDNDPRAAHEWFDVVRDYTVRLARIRSASPSAGETAVAKEVVHMLVEGDPVPVYTEYGLDPVRDDPYGRHNAYALLRGDSTRTIVLMGHIDTVGTADYGALEPWATDPEGLTSRAGLLAGSDPDLAADLATDPDGWLFGRGVADMKSGVAAAVAVMRDLTLRGDRSISVVLLATVDEENESAGVLQGVALLDRLKKQYNLEYLGTINTDYTCAQYPGDPHRYIYEGTVGKVLPSFYVVGAAAHAGEPFSGLDANVLASQLVNDIAMNVDLCDEAEGQVGPPPVTLHMADLKTAYDTQLPLTAHVYFNIVTLRRMPDEWLERVWFCAEQAMRRVLATVDEAERRHLVKIGRVKNEVSSRSGCVFTYEELAARVREQIGGEAMDAAVREVWEQGPSSLDKRQRSLELVERLWSLSGYQGPAIVVYFGPPYYPHVAPAPGPLHESVAAVIAAHPELPLASSAHFPLLSDLSYLNADMEFDVDVLTRNMPVWRDENEAGPSGGYSIPFSTIRSISMPVVNVGPYGRAVHQRGERVLMGYSFGVLPMLIEEIIHHVAAHDPLQPPQPTALSGSGGNHDR